MNKEVRFTVGDMVVKVFYDATSETVTVSAIHPISERSERDADALMYATRISANGCFPSEPPESFYFTNGNFLECLKAQHLDRISIFVNLGGNNATNHAQRAIDVCKETGLRLNDDTGELF